jgi:hypothetical protein
LKVRRDRRRNGVTRAGPGGRGGRQSGEGLGDDLCLVGKRRKVGYADP